MYILFYLFIFIELYFYTLKQIINNEPNIPWQQQRLKEKEK